MIELYYWPTPNNHKLTLFLEESGVKYRLHFVDISKNEQFAAEFLKISPNNKVPALVDDQPADGGEPIHLFESGAMLRYLAIKENKFYGETERDRARIDQWLFWQMAGLGPMTGQLGHFTKHAKESVPYAINRYSDEVKRLLGVLEKQLGLFEYVAGRISIADMAIYPWIKMMPDLGLSLASYPELTRWSSLMASRPATLRAYAAKDRADLRA